jgi:hypothetical protein
VTFHYFLVNWAIVQNRSARYLYVQIKYICFREKRQESKRRSFFNEQDGEHGERRKEVQRADA